MGDRKPWILRYPHDDYLTKIPRCRRSNNQKIKVRIMLPMNILCNTCGTFIYKGTKFNSFKQDVIGETYLGIQIFRFYFKCTKCSAELTIKTDPQNSDFVVESGAARICDEWRDEYEEVDEAKWKIDAEEMGDAMKSLENVALDSKKDMDIFAFFAALEKMRSKKGEEDEDLKPMDLAEPSNHNFKVV